MKHVMRVVQHRSGVDYQVSIYHSDSGYCSKWSCMGCGAGGIAGDSFETPTTALNAARTCIDPHQAEKHSATSDRLSFPLWIIQLSDTITCSGDIASTTAGKLAIFRTAERALDFASARERNADDMRIRLLTQGRTLLLLADMHQWGVDAICLDPAADGGGGRVYGLHEFVAQAIVSSY